MEVESREKHWIITGVGMVLHYFRDNKECKREREII